MRKRNKKKKSQHIDEIHYIIILFRSYLFSYLLFKSFSTKSQKYNVQSSLILLQLR